MADQLVDPATIETLLGVSSAEANRLADQATSLVQEATDQRLVQVVGDQLTIMGTTDSWLALPQIPVTNVSQVEINGNAITDFKRFGSRLWRKCGWSSNAYEPSTVDVTYTHGYSPDNWRLERARTAAFGLIVELYDNPSGSSGGFSIDDYREGGAGGGGSESGVKVPDGVARDLRRFYGRRAGLVRIG